MFIIHLLNARYITYPIHFELEHAFPIHGDAFLVSSGPHQSIPVSIQRINRIMRQAPGIPRIICHLNHLSGLFVEYIYATIIFPEPNSSLPVLGYDMDKISLIFPGADQIGEPFPRRHIINPQAINTTYPNAVIPIHKKRET